MATKDAFSAYALNHLLCLNQKYKFNITPTEFLILAAMTFSGGTKPTCAPEKKFKYKQVNPVLRSLIIGGSWFQKVVDWTHFLAQFLQISEEFPEPKDIYIGRYFILYYHWIIEGIGQVVGKLWNIVQNNSLLSAGVKRIFRDCLNKFHFVEEADGNEDCSIDGAEEEEALLADDIGEFDEDPQDILHPDSEGIEELPILKYRDIVIEHIATHRVTCIEGETGSGKSTQVPQFILDDYRRRGVGRKPSIIVTQPRRMAAKTLAERVARERHTTLGTEVGYKIGQDYQASNSTSILFVTTGFIIRPEMIFVHNSSRWREMIIQSYDYYYYDDNDDDYSFHVCFRPWFMTLPG
ncbi:uncharacterized protein LOC112041869 [Lingula anatina]|uniref:Uncharacterized protein LOC112041869 n=1 Tax=Lingula anatina TaxID=7574 RepID=A0A2R2MME2_LINAN|nr:uncharacterized protein LOC112041869 [Lingula anatina]|eukprot:XP_023931380.1 uncharacterized protein LOC112041869 [Lingula anatina]